MSRVEVRFSAYVSVYDKRALYDAAVARCRDDNLGTTQESLDEMLLCDGEINVAACVHMLLDPGLSPAGCEISEAECAEVGGL